MANRLVDEKSPYLRQHAENPVEWHPFSDEAFEKAREADIPVFLSVGYSTCHWCHVMNRESFSSQEVAEALSGRFIAVKVDREERPDIDRIAMISCQLMTGGGGWPLTLVLTPDKRPFFAGTYIPKEPRYGSAGLLQILDRIWELWHERRDEAERLGRRVEEAVQSYLAGDILVPEMADPIDDPLDTAYAALLTSFDQEYGGFGERMKFPSPHLISFLLRYGGVARIHDATEMAQKTLHTMRKGSINDQIGGGFHRYTTDRQWMIPHYEKMATDQALLLYAFSEGYRITGDPLLKAEALRIAAYIRSDLTSPEGLFYTAEDAESGGEEGAFYLWSKEEIRSLFDHDDGGQACALLLGDASWTERRPLALHVDNVDPIWLKRVRETLADARKRRTRPFRDEKILLDTNAMIIGALARAGFRMNEPDLITMAEEAYSIIQTVINESDEALFHARMNGAIISPAFLPDYAEMIAASIELHQATQNTEYLLKAISYTEAVVSLFYNPDGSWFWFEEEGHALFRTRDTEDSAGPSGNAIMLHNLLLLYRITGNQEFGDMAHAIMEQMRPALLHHPQAYIHSISSLFHLSSAALDIITTGSPKVFSEAIRSSQNPLITHLHLSPDVRSSAEILPKVMDFSQDSIEPTAYPCRVGSCLPLITNPEELKMLLDSAFYRHSQQKQLD